MTTASRLKHILFVDDDPGARLIVETMLRARLPGVRVTTAIHGAQALVVLERGPVDLMITDLGMPVMDGVELLLNIAQRRILVPVLVVTANGSPVAETVALAGGAIEYFEKPLEEARFVRCVQDLLLAGSGRSQLEVVSLAGIVRLISADRRTCTLQVTSAQAQGVLTFAAGDLIDARQGELCGLPAALTILAWHDVTMNLDITPRSRTRTIHASIADVLNQASRRPLAQPTEIPRTPAPRAEWVPAPGAARPPDSTTPPSTTPPAASNQPARPPASTAPPPASNQPARPVILNVVSLQPPRLAAPTGLPPRTPPLTSPRITPPVPAPPRVAAPPRASTPRTQGPANGHTSRTGATTSAAAASPPDPTNRDEAAPTIPALIATATPDIAAPIATTDIATPIATSTPDIAPSIATTDIATPTATAPDIATPIATTDIATPDIAAATTDIATPDIAAPTTDIAPPDIAAPTTDIATPDIAAATADIAAPDIAAATTDVATPVAAAPSDIGPTVAIDAPVQPRSAAPTPAPAVAAASDYSESDTYYDLVDRARDLLRIAEFEAAERLLRRALEVQPGDRVAQQNLQVLARRRGAQSTEHSFSPSP
jgi:CheY-like chemotaxis protein